MEVRRLTIRWRYRKVLTKTVMVAIIGYWIAYVVGENISKICQKEYWKFCFGISTIIFALFLFLIILIIIIKGIKYFVFPIKKIVVKNRKKIRYNKIIISQTITQKMFGLMNYKFVDTNTKQKLVLHDVSKKLLKYVKTDE